MACVVLIMLLLFLPHLHCGWNIRHLQMIGGRICRYRPTHWVCDGIELILVCVSSPLVLDCGILRLIEALLLELVVFHYFICSDMLDTFFLQNVLTNLFEALIDSSIILKIQKTESTENIYDMNTCFGGSVLRLLLTDMSSRTNSLSITFSFFNGEFAISCRYTGRS